MKVRYLKDGEQVEVGDIIIHTHTFGSAHYTVHRVTPKYAYVRFNDVAEGKFPRVVGFGFTSLPRAQWPLTEYKACRPAPVQEEPIPTIVK